MVESLLQDVRYAGRALRKNASFAAIAVTTLALGIGANTAIFSVVNGVLLRPLAVRDPDRIVTVMSYAASQPPSVYGSSPANFMDLRRDTRAASQFAAFSTSLATVVDAGEPESFQAVTTVGDASPTVEALIALLGGAAAAGSHLTKTSTRAAANTSPEPFSNWVLSLGEDLFVVGLGFLALRYPIAALVVAGTLLVLIVVFAAVIIRKVRGWFRRRAAA